jgi:hypothetical protein
MTKANAVYHKRDLSSDGAVMTLARYHARETIKRELKAQGIKLASVESCEITRAANRYIDDHPEIIAFATLVLRRSLLRKSQVRRPTECS